MNQRAMESFPDREGRLTISIDSRLDQVFLVGYAVRGICSQLGVEDDHAGHLELAVVEGVNNAIKHAYGLQKGHAVEIVVVVNGEEIRFDICDDGDALDFQHRICLEYDPHDKDNLPERGMGLHIMEAVVDEINYCRRPRAGPLTLRYRRIRGPARGDVDQR